MSETRINVSQTTITAEEIGASSAVDTMPIASASNLGKVIQYVGTTDANYTNGYFYKCVSIESPESFVKIEDVSYEPSDPCYWEISVTDFEKFRSTYCMQDDQVVASRLYFGIGGWDNDVGYNYTTETDFVPKYSTDIDGLSLDDIHYSYGSADYQGDGVIYQYTPAGAITYTWKQIDVQDAIANKGTGVDSFAIGEETTANKLCSLSVGFKAQATGKGAVAIGVCQYADEQSRKTAQGPIASGTSSIAIGGGSTRSYTDSSAQATGHQSISIGALSKATSDDSLAFGTNAESKAKASIAIGCEIQANAEYSIQLGTTDTYVCRTYNNDANTFKVANSNGNFEMMSADGTIPAARLADTTSAVRGNILTMGTGGKAFWGPSVSIPASTITLLTSNWTTDVQTGKINQTVTVQGVTANSIVFIGAAPASVTDWDVFGVLCVEQGTDQLKFEATNVPNNNITVNVVILA